ncbi:hypothetical protein A1Q1_05410 [Trichosporon asahii var. asahii CBS 2479]|uniref:Uncharacterized protein n=1 Tax=Trichosporon asahii var. asahii (strain ATCC 90039 / CBS 2479 / JCM 2466 / KCTC 7840 / NBRC 103889/ NCYC 2677 / UAMH 7654) TaxID=1186058 RepID=J4U760_TRIAS|nr:hypothetical protein A1Q1_05410 [Trichosporon asahii var. asahii CBS 2479]EJT46080.1 hypothetical protein A1Q1_05410 [Trichosporon asahii var. asahii CBS 2479]
MALDANRFPHLLDAVVNAVIDGEDETSIHSLRRTNHSVRDFIDRHIVRHVACTRRDDEVCDENGRPRRVFAVFTAVGRVRLDYGRPRVAARVRTLDIYADKLALSLPAHLHTCEPIQFPNLRYVRMFCDRWTELRGWISRDASGITMIIPITASRASFWSILLYAAPRAFRRWITVAPAQMFSDGRPDEPFTWSSDPLERSNAPEDTATGVNHSILHQDPVETSEFAELTGRRPSDLPFGKSFVSSVLTFEEAAEELKTDQQRALGQVTIRDCALAGPERLTRHFVDEYRSESWNPCPEEYPCRFVTLSGWRAQMTDEEWELVQSIPKSCWKLSEGWYA